MPYENISKTAYATPIKYNITINPVGGTFTGTNPTSYTIESGDITLINPQRPHSYFE
jgi:hypothetical protein